MKKIIDSIDGKARAARVNHHTAMVMVINQAEYEHDRADEVLSIVDEIIGMVSCREDNSLFFCALRELLEIESGYKGNSSAKLTAQTDVRMNIDRDLDALEERIVELKSEIE
jgi:hypothetical protein